LVEFVLVHGAYHGAWCWELLSPELEKRGHSVLTVDLPIGDPKAGAVEYASTVLDAMSGVGDEAILVGHSMGGVVVPLIAAARPVARMVFLAALLPEPGSSLGEQRAREPVDAVVELSAVEFTHLGDGVFEVGPNTATELFYHDAPEEIAAAAISRLRPQAYLFMDETTPLQAWPDCDAEYIVCGDDHAVNPAWGRQAAAERLNVTPHEIEGGHSPFLTRPSQLADMLDGIARKP
jgi:pimeloyl-ACP methyl ester carboxylesterase